MSETLLFNCIACALGLLCATQIHDRDERRTVLIIAAACAFGCILAVFKFFSVPEVGLGISSGSAAFVMSALAVAIWRLKRKESS